LRLEDEGNALLSRLRRPSGSARLTRVKTLSSSTWIGAPKKDGSWSISGLAPLIDQAVAEQSLDRNVLTVLVTSVAEALGVIVTVVWQEDSRP
jgi:hypothetical protein